MISKNSKIYVAGHNGLVGSAIVRSLKKRGYKKILTASRKKLDLTNPEHMVILQGIADMYKEATK